MMSFFKPLSLCLILGLAPLGGARAQDAIAVAPDGSVSIPGTLTVGTIDNDALNKIAEALTWYVFAPNVYDAFVQVTDNPQLLHDNEFMINRNRGMRRLHFSSWNGGMRLVTDPYMTGDRSSLLGGSVWVYKTWDPNSETCESGKAFHYYYKYDNGKVANVTGNGCQAETTIYARKYVFR